MKVSQYIFIKGRKINISNNINYKTIEQKENNGYNSNRTSKGSNSQVGKVQHRSSFNYFSFLNTASTFWKEKFCYSKPN